MMMNTKNNNQDPAQVAGNEIEKVLTYDGKKEFERYSEWLQQMHVSTAAFSKLFNAHFNEVLNSETPFDKLWFVGFMDRTAWGRLKLAIENFVEGQNKAVRTHFEKYYKDRYDEAVTAWGFVNQDYLACNVPPAVLQKQFPTHLLSPQSLPFKDGAVDHGLNFLNSVREDFNEYLTNKDDIKFYNLMLKIAEGYNEINQEIKRRGINLDLEPPLKGVPFLLTKDDSGKYVPMTPNLKNVLSVSLNN